MRLQQGLVHGAAFRAGTEGRQTEKAPAAIRQHLRLTYGLRTMAQSGGAQVSLCTGISLRTTWALVGAPLRQCH